MTILNFPNIRQTSDYDCGAAVLQAVLFYYGYDVRQDSILTIAGTNKSFGTTVNGILKALDKYKLKYDETTLTIEDIKKFLQQKIPVILLIQAWTGKKSNAKHNWKEDWDNGHYVVAIGYDDTNVYFEDPSSCNRSFLTYQEFENRWHGLRSEKTPSHHLGIAVYGKKPEFDRDKFIHLD